MANASLNMKGPNAAYIPPARVGSLVGHYRLGIPQQYLGQVVEDTSLNV